MTNEVLEYIKRCIVQQLDIKFSACIKYGMTKKNARILLNYYHNVDCFDFYADFFEHKLSKIIMKGAF